MNSREVIFGLREQLVMMVSAEESPSHPQELWRVAAATVDSLNVINPGPLPPIGRTSVSNGSQPQENVFTR